ncbi:MULTISPECIES: hypothetical protein [unclassified Bradyrhizobium]|uniref:hypothetical protein n=1 Tax=unclassified Bradyrhizobium TaxID=2631580 RepID=UPI003397C240
MTTRARASASKHGLQDTWIDLAAALELIHLLGVGGGIHKDAGLKQFDKGSRRFMKAAGALQAPDIKSKQSRRGRRGV